MSSDSAAQDQEWVEFPCGHRWQGVFRDPPTSCPICEQPAAQDRDCCWIGDPCLIHNPPPSESAICQDCKATVTPSGYCVMCGRYNDDKPTSGVKRMSDHASDCPAWSGSVCRCESPAAHVLLCLARWESGRPYPCVLPKGHDGQHQHPMDPVPTDHFLAASA